VIDRLCAVGALHSIYYLWCPVVADAKDDLVLELAVAARYWHVVTQQFAGFEGVGFLWNCRRFADRITASRRRAIMTRINVELSTSVHDRAQALADREGVSVDQIVAAALAEKLSILEEEGYFRERAKHGTKEAFDRVMAKVPARAPLPGDELPAGDSG
jgi:hypothetical protein